MVQGQVGQSRARFLLIWVPAALLMVAVITAVSARFPFPAMVVGKYGADRRNSAEAARLCAGVSADRIDPWRELLTHTGQLGQAGTCSTAQASWAFDKLYGAASILAATAVLTLFARRARKLRTTTADRLLLESFAVSFVAASLCFAGTFVWAVVTLRGPEAVVLQIFTASAVSGTVCMVLNPALVMPAGASRHGRTPSGKLRRH